MSDLEPVGRHLSRAARLPGVDPMVLEARREWAGAVGPDIARNAAPVRRAGDTLVVHCASSTWAGELTLLERQVLASLSRVLTDAPVRLRFEVGQVQPPPDPPPPPRPLPPLREEQSRRAQELVSEVADPALAARIREAIELSLRRGG